MRDCAGLDQIEQRLHALLGAHREKSFLLEQEMVRQHQCREASHVRRGSQCPIP